MTREGFTVDTVFQHFTTHFKFFPYVRTETVKPWQTEEVTTVLHIPETEYKALFDRYYDVKKSIMISDAKKQRERENCMYNKDELIPIFFTIDDGYAPYLHVALNITYRECFRG